MDDTKTATQPPARVGQGELFPTGNAGFDNELYVAQQSSAIMRRVKQFAGKLYLEFGGKLIFDYHAARVLPGYDPNGGTARRGDRHRRQLTAA